MLWNVLPPQPTTIMVIPQGHWLKSNATNQNLIIARSSTTDEGAPPSVQFFHADQFL